MSDFFELNDRLRTGDGRAFMAGETRFPAELGGETGVVYASGPAFWRGGLTQSELQLTASEVAGLRLENGRGSPADVQRSAAMDKSP